MTDRPPSATDVLIVGAGIAGASLAAALAPWRRVVLAEAEDAPGYHATGRSAAFWHETYGGRSEEHTSELQSLIRISYAVFCLKKKRHKQTQHTPTPNVTTTATKT